MNNDAGSPASLAAYFTSCYPSRATQLGSLSYPSTSTTTMLVVEYSRPHLGHPPEDSRELVKPYIDEPTTPSEPTHEMLTTIFSIRKANAIKRCPSGTTVLRIWDRFCRMVQELHAGGWLADRGYSVAHLDYAPRNILVDLTAKTRRPIISAILDWDSAVLAPKFMSCSPPLWIWAWQEDEDEDERTANDDPPNPEARQLKAQFESAAGPDYIRLAYGPPYRLARRLVRFAVEGVRSNEDYKEAEVMLQEWADLYTSTMSSRLLLGRNINHHAVCQYEPVSGFHRCDDVV